MLVVIVYYTSFMFDATLASSHVGLVAVLGQNASISCPCPRGQCLSWLIRWIKVYPNQFLETSETFCEPQRCLFETGSTSTKLTLLHVRKEDSALYFCGEKQLAHLDFSQGTFLQVLEQNEVWNTTCKVTLLKELKSSVDIKYRRERRHADLRCRLSGLRVPWADIVWRSTGRNSRILSNFTWVSRESSESFSVWSQIVLEEPRVPLPDGQHYGEIDEKMAGEEWEEEDEWEEEEEEKGEAEEDCEWWCEVHLEPNLTVKSDRFVVKWRKDPDWCLIMLYPSLAICVLGAMVFMLRCSRCLSQQYNSRVREAQQSET